MIERLISRARRHGLLDCIDARQVPAYSMVFGGLEGNVDFTLAFAPLHEMPSAANLFAEAAWAMKSGATLLFAEPAGHVSETEFRDELAAAAACSLKIISRPSLSRCIAALLEKP